MARSYGRLFTSIWNDDDFRHLSVGAKLMYALLISQDDLEHSGIIGWRPARWARELGEPVDDVIAWCKELDQARYVVVDEVDAVELLVRSLIRRDDIWKQPNVFKAAAASAKASQSPRIKAALYSEVKRLTLIGANRETHALRDELLSHLEPFANPSPNPPEGFRNSSGTIAEGHDNGSGGVPDGFTGSSGGESRAACPQPQTGESDAEVIVAGQNPSGTPREPSANASAGVTGKGKGNGPVPEGFPIPHSPSSVAPAGAPLALWPSAVPDLRTGEGEDRSGDEDPGIDALVAEVRRARPAWSTKSILRALMDPSVAERPWPTVRAAMLAVAADPGSQHPGRLAHDGPWWAAAVAEQPGRRGWPEWCRAPACNEWTRRLEDGDGRDAGACPSCHPLGGTIREAL